MQIVQHPDIFLREPTSEVKLPLGPEDQIILDQMIDTMYRNNGIGSQLLDLTLSKSGLIGSKVIFLETRKTNDTAIYLYNKYEFKKVGIRPNYYKTKDGKEDAIVYCKRLDLSRT